MVPPDQRESITARRKHRRVAAREVTAEIRVGTALNSYPVLNISTGGLLIGGGPPPPTRELLEIELRLANTRPVHVTGRVVHQLPQGAGVAFEPFGSVIADSLERLIAAVDEQNSRPPPLPVRGHKDEPLRSADPFAVGPDPRPPRTGSPEERVDYLRALVKKREEALQRGKAAFLALTTDADELRASSARLQSRLDATASQLAVGEAALAASRKAAEKHAADLDQERDTAREMLEQEQRRTLEAIATVAGLEAKMRRFESEAAAARQEAELARQEVRSVASEATALRKTREELGLANKKAMEAQVTLSKERAGRLAAEAKVEQASASRQAPDGEVKKLTAELARLKSKLIAAESALERSATRKAPDPRASRKP